MKGSLGGRLRGVALAAISLGVLAGCGGAQDGSPPAANGPGGTAPACTDQWTVIPVAYPKNRAEGSQGQGRGLAGISAVSASDVWAVGSYDVTQSNPDTSLAGTLTEHWDGSHWSIVSAPDIRATGGDGLNAVAAVATNDVWAVGAAGTDQPTFPTTTLGNPTAGVEQTLIEHWDGTRWAIVPAPDVSYGGAAAADTLSTVAVVNANDIWAAGNAEFDAVLIDPLPAEPLFEHWDGMKWSIVPAPDPVALPPTSAMSGTSSQTYGTAVITGLAAISSNDVWAVGSYAPAGNGELAAHETLLEHWDGTKWSIVPAPDVSVSQELSNGTTKADDHLLAVASGGAGIYAVGDAPPAGAIAVRIDQGKPSLLTVPTISATGFGQSALAGVIVDKDDAWAAGVALLHDVHGTWQPFYTAGGASFGSLNAITRVSDTEFWATGAADFVHHRCQ